MKVFPTETEGHRIRLRVGDSSIAYILYSFPIPVYPFTPVSTGAYRGATEVESQRTRLNVGDSSIPYILYSFPPFSTEVESRWTRLKVEGWGFQCILSRPSLQKWKAAGSD